MPEYEVEKIVEERTIKKGNKRIRQYKIRWLGYSSEHDRWKTEKELRNAPEVIKEWKQTSGSTIHPNHKKKKENDMPLTPELGIIEASHVCNLYYVYANCHNDHYSPYSENHPDPLECCIHAMPDIEVFLMDDDHPPQWFLGVDLTHALHGAYTHALCVFGKAVQPVGWNCCKPWANYNYATELVKIGFPYIPHPICFKEDVYHFPADSFHKLQQQVHHNNFYAICLNALSIIITATKQMEYSNIAHVGYICGSPACVLAHCFWCRLHGHPVVEHSKDNLSNAGFPVNGYDGNNKALGPITLPPENVPPPQLVDFAEVPFDYAAWGLPP
ncbi:hypothetical protein RhiTH_010350 [Rhizoctonia solani]